MAILERDIPAASPRKWTRADYYGMVDAGILQPGERVELLEGEIVELSPVGPLHRKVSLKLYDVLREMVGDAYYIMHESPVTLSDATEPQPDVAVAITQPDGYEGRHPASGEVLLAVEVAATSLAGDRTRKARIYAEAGIPTYWIVSLAERHVEAHTEPSPVGYANRHLYTPEDKIALPFADNPFVLVRRFLS